MSDDCHLCSAGECPVPDCPHRLPWRPGTDEDELGAAHEPVDCGEEE